MGGRRMRVMVLLLFPVLSIFALKSSDAASDSSFSVRLGYGLTPWRNSSRCPLKRGSLHKKQSHRVYWRGTDQAPSNRCKCLI